MCKGSKNFDNSVKKVAESDYYLYMKHYVYQIDNLINGMYYRGKHSAESLDNDYMGSGTLIKAAIEDLGVDNFKKTILATFPTSDEAFEYEAQVVTMKEVNDPMCYNLMPGGRGGQKRFTDEELRERKREQGREWREQNPNYMSEYLREYQQQPERKEYRHEYNQRPEVKERKKEYDRKWCEQNPNYMSEYYQQNKESISEHQREYNQRPEVKARKHEYYLKRKAAASK